MKKMKKGTLILLIVIAVLVVAVAVFAILKRRKPGGKISAGGKCTVQNHSR